MFQGETKLCPNGTSKRLSFLIYQKFLKKRTQKDYDISSFKNTSKYACRSCVNFKSFKIALKKYNKTKQIFRPSKVYQKSYIKMPSVFPPSKLRGQSTSKLRVLSLENVQGKCIKMSPIIRPSNLFRTNQINTAPSK